MKHLEYRGYDIICTDWNFKLYQAGSMVLSDSNTIDGERIRNIKQAEIEAKKNVNTIHRLNYFKPQTFKMI